MTKDTLENLSCLMDGELSSDAGRFLVRRAGSDAELGESWERYHLIRDCLRRPGESLGLVSLKLDLSQLDDSGAPGQGAEADWDEKTFGHASVAQPSTAQGTASAAGAQPSWRRPLAGGAIAASVAAVAIAVTLNLNPNPAAGPSPAEPFASPNSAGLAPVSQPASFNAGSAANQRSLNRYLLRHNQAAGAVGQQGFVSLVPIDSTATLQLVEPPQKPVEETPDESPATDASR